MFDPKIGGGLSEFMIEEKRRQAIFFDGNHHDDDQINNGKKNGIEGVVVRIKGNWGQEGYTCLYRVRVHGDEVVID